jgi:hemolysin activation/secretion protein
LRSLHQKFLIFPAVLTLVAALLSPLAHGAASPRFEISRFVVQGNTLLTDAEVEAALAPFRGAGRDFGDVQRALAALQKAYAARGFNAVKVALPEQELNEGVVRLQVVEARIGRVTIEGNRFFDSANIRRSLPGLREGETPNIGRISASLAQANENPAKKTTLQLQGAERDGEVDARLIVTDEKPWTLALNADNTGNDATGKTMVGVVYQNANVAGLDHVLSLQYTTSIERPERVGVYGAGYHMPIYSLGDSIDVYANYADINSGSVLAGIFELQVSGKGTVFGTRYNHAFGHLGPVESTLTLGFEQKAYRNVADYQGFDLGNDVTVRPLSLAYWGTWRAGAATTVYTLSAVRNIPGGKHGGDEDFALARNGASADYSLARYGIAHTRELPRDWQLKLAAVGQYTRDALVPGEQFGMGGMGSVRGFLSREFVGDKGYSGTVEVYTPELCARVPGASAFCRVLAFYDAGRVKRNDPLPGEMSNVSIGSIGLGLRAAVGRHATLQLDYGHVIDAGSTGDKGDNRFNFKLSLWY